MSLADQQWCPTSVQVTVLQARGLRIKGKSGTNDAYALMQLGKEKYQTSVVEKSIAPVWKEEATFDLPPQLLGGGGGAERSTLHVHVLHRALVGPDKLLGQAVINLLQLSEDKTRNKTEWFKLLDKTGKPDKDRGEVLVDIQFMRNNMTASMFDLSAAGKSRSRLSKFKDKVRGKKKESDSASSMVPSFTQVLTDSEEEEPNGEEVGEASRDGKSKKHKMKSLFSPKSNLQRNMSQSMSVLPAKNSSLSGSQSSGLNVDLSEGKKKFKFKIHKRSGSSDSKDSSSGHQKQLPVEQSNLCINGSHIYCEEPPPRTSRTGSNYSLASSGRGSMEDVPENSPPSVDSLRAARQYSPWMEEEEEEEETAENIQENVDESKREEEERIKMEERKRLEEETVRRQKELESLAEEKLRQEEERKKLEEKVRREEEKRKREEEDIIWRENEKRRQEEERAEQRRQEENKLAEEKKLKEEEERKIEKEKARCEEEQKRKEEERAEEERRRKDAEEMMRKLEELKRQREEEGRLKQEEVKRQEEERARKKEEYERLMEEKKLEEEKKRIEAEEKLRNEEEEKMRMEEEMKTKEDEERRARRGEELEEKRRLEEQERKTVELEKMQREEEERIRKERLEQEEETLRRQQEELEKVAKEKLRQEEEERRKVEEEKVRREEEEKIRREEEMRQKEQDMIRRQEEEQERLSKEILRQKEEKNKLEEMVKREEEEQIRRKEEMKQREEEKVRKEKETSERLAMETKRLQEQEKRTEEEAKKEEEERIRREERKEQEAKKLEKEILTREVEECEKKESGTNGGRAAGNKSKVSSPTDITSTNPFDEDFSYNPSAEIPSSSSGPHSHKAKEKSVQERCQSSVSVVGSRAISGNEKDPVGTQREKRPAPQPPGKNQAERERQDQQDMSEIEQTKDKTVKTVSVLPQRSVQIITPLSKSPTDSENTQSVRQDTGTKVTSARHSKRLAPSRPHSVGEPSSESKTTLSHKGVSETKESACSLNPFEDDEDENELTAQDDTAVSGPVHWPPIMSQNADKDASSQVKVKSLKMACAPQPPAKNDTTSSNLINHNNAGGHITGTANRAGSGGNVQESPNQELQQTKVKNVAVAGVKEEGPPSSRRLQPVKPLSPPEQKSASVVQVENNKSPGILSGDEVDGGLAGPYSQLTREELISLVLKQESQLSERDKKISELEQYIDNLLVRVMEEKPSILMSLTSLKKAI